MDKTITLTLPDLFAGQILDVLYEEQMAWSYTRSYVLGGHLTAKEAFKLIKHYQEITDAIEQQYDNA